MSLLVPVSLTRAQEVEVRDLCSPVTLIQAVKVEVERSEPFKIEVDQPEPYKIETDEVRPYQTEENTSNDEESQSEEAAIPPPHELAYGQCVEPSPIGFHYAPAIDTAIRQFYEDSLANANGVTESTKLSNIIVDVTINVTTPPGIFYRREDTVVGRFQTVESCMRARRRSGNVGVCGPREGPVFVSLTGAIVNRNNFPLRGVMVGCTYLTALDEQKSFRASFPHILGMDGRIPLQDWVVAKLPPRSVVRDISCKPEAAEIWQRTDNIQTLSVPYNPRW